MDFERTYFFNNRYKFEKRFVFANFFFESPYVTKVTKDAKMSFYDKLVMRNGHIAS